MITIQQHREGRGRTRFALALKVGVQPLAVSLWERCRQLPQAVSLCKLGEVFGLCSDEIALEPRGLRARPQG